MPDVLHTDSKATAVKGANALASAKIFGQVKIRKNRPYDEIGTRQEEYSVWVSNDQGGAAAAVLHTLFKGRRK